MDFLQNDAFILWQLAGGAELEAYWASWAANNPSEKEGLEAAAGKFSAVRLAGGRLSPNEQLCLRQRIQASANRQARKRRRRASIRYAAAACLLAAFAAALHYAYSPGEPESFPQEAVLDAGRLEGKEICLATGAATVSFAKDILVRIDENGQITAGETAGGGKSAVLESSPASMNKLIVPYGKRSRLELADGTKLWLNSGSVLQFPTRFGGKSRNVYLEGEMYAEAAEDLKKPFLVHTPAFRVKVRGTSFNVSAYRGGHPQSVVLVEGSVSVQTAYGEGEAGETGETVLLPNRMLVRRGKHWDEKEVDVREYVSWKDGYLLLNRTPLGKVLRRMERYYNLSFEMQNPADAASKTCTGKIYFSDNPEDVMEALSLLYSVQYERKEGIIRIHANP